MSIKRRSVTHRFALALWLVGLFSSPLTSSPFSRMEHRQRAGNVAWNASLTHDSIRLVITKYGFKIMDVNRKVRCRNH